MKPITLNFNPTNFANEVPQHFRYDKCPRNVPRKAIPRRQTEGERNDEIRPKSTKNASYPATPTTKNI